MADPTSPMLAHVLALVMFLALLAYALSGGADFGGGVWDLLARGPRRERQRALIEAAIGPIWEANHVWLILVVVLLFAAFPPAFARIATVLHVPLTLALVGIVLRGSAFAFRSYGGHGEAAERRWGRVFAIASIVTPLLFGMCVGALATGRVGTSPTTDGFMVGYVWPWLTPFTIGVGVLTLLAFAFLAAVYLTVATNDVELAGDFRQKALWTALALVLCALGTLALAGDHAPLVWHALTASRFAWMVHALTGAAAVSACVALARRRFRLARVAAAALVTGVLAGWAVAGYPWLVPPSLTIVNAAAPSSVLRALLIALGAGAVLLIPSLIYLLRLFASVRTPPPASS